MTGLKQSLIGGLLLIAGIVGIVLVGGFLGILMWWLKSVPLTIIMGGVAGLMIWDVAKTLKETHDTTNG